MSSPNRAFWETVQSIIIALVLAFLIRTFLVESFIVQGRSMEVTLFDGERLFVEKLSYRWHEPQRGDIVVFRYPLDPSRDFIKRVIAVGGDYVEIRMGQIYVNGQAIQEPYVANRDLQSYPKTRVPPGSIFVLGDNRRNSEDSRVFGAVDLRYVKGRAFLVYWPISKIQFLTQGR